MKKNKINYGVVAIIAFVTALILALLTKYV